MRAQEGFSLKNKAADTYPVTLGGGQYAWQTNSTGTGSIDLKRLGADGTTAVAVATQIVATTGWQTGLYLPPGTYQIIIASFTANYVDLQRIPTD